MQNDFATTATIKALGMEDDSELEKINLYTLRPVTKEEVFTCKVLACSNEVDRDLECFSQEALQELAELYKGRSVIFDHTASTKNQVARIYDAKVVVDSTKKTKTGADYATLILYLFIPRIEKTKDLISEIEMGIKKEVSVDCCVGKRACTICGKDAWCCEHKPGEEYDGAFCAAELSEVKDAYELSFVAVPAQKDAGTQKNANKNPKQEKKTTVLDGFKKFLQI